MAQHTVEKIGGTSMSQFDMVLNNVIIGNRRGDDLYQRIFVVSAYGGITNMLLEHKKTGQPGVYQLFAAGDPSYDEALTAVGDKMCEINAGFAGIGLDVAAADTFVRDRIEGIRNCLRDLRRLGSYGHFRLDDQRPAVREMLSAVGEAHSANNSAMILREHGVRALFVDLTGWMDEEDLLFEAKIATTFSRVELAHELPIATGYTKCREGIMTTYDRGYSEITFSKIATVTEAREGVIHKEFHLSTGDPKLVGEDRVKIIGQTNFDVADQLADVGMEAIHPKAAKPMEMQGIPIRVKNAFDPEHPGTLISKDYRSESPRVEMITGCREMVGIEVLDAEMVGRSGYDYDLLGIFKAFGISYIAKNTNANTITHYVPAGTPRLAECIARLEHSLTSATIRVVEVALVSAIGSNMSVPGFLYKAAHALSELDINILAMDQCMRQVNMQFIVAREDFDGAVVALHRGLVENA